MKRHSDYKLGMIFRVERRRQKLSVHELESRTGVSASTIYNFERGDVSSPSFDTVALLARELQLSLDEIAMDLSFNNCRNVRSSCNDG